MAPDKTNEAYEERLATLEEMGIEEKALVYDEAANDISISEDEAARLLCQSVSRMGVGKR